MSSKNNAIQLLLEIEKVVDERAEIVRGIHTIHDSEKLLMSLGNSTVVLAAIVRALLEERLDEKERVNYEQ